MKDDWNSCWTGLYIVGYANERVPAANKELKINFQIRKCNGLFRTDNFDAIIHQRYEGYEQQLLLVEPYV